MACLGNCSICGGGTMNDSTCGDCEKETTRRVLAGEPIDKKSIKEAVEKIRSSRRDREMQEQLARMAEDDGRNSWRTYMNERNRAYEVIDKTIAMIDAYGNNSEMQFLRDFLDSIDTGRKAKKKLETAKKLIRKVFGEEENDGS